VHENMGKIVCLDTIILDSVADEKADAYLASMPQRENSESWGELVTPLKADTYTASTCVGEAAQDMPVTPQATVQDMLVTPQATPSDVEGSLLATFNNSIVIDIADPDDPPVWTGDEELVTVKKQAALDVGGFSPKLIEDQVSASVLQEAFANWSPEAGTATPRSEEHISGSGSSAIGTPDQQAETPPLMQEQSMEIFAEDSHAPLMKEQSMQIFREASEGCGL